MYLVEIFLPIFDNAGVPFPKQQFDRVRRELTDRFGGVTAFVRSPADGLWTDAAGQVRRDEIAIFDVMTDTLDHDWWRAYRKRLEEGFRQEEIVIRATAFDRL